MCPNARSAWNITLVLGSEFMSPIKLVIVTAQTVTMYNNCGQEYSTTKAEDARRDSKTHSMADFLLVIIQ